MKVIDRYIAKELLLTTTAVTSVLILILIAQALSSVLGDAVADGLPLGTVSKLLAYNIVGLLGVVVPLSILLSTLITVGRLYRDSEMAAFNACGVSLLRFCQPALMVASGFAVFAALLSLVVTPWSLRQQEALVAGVAKQSPLAFLSPGTFSDIGSGAGTFYSEQISKDGKRISTVFVYTESDDEWAVEVAEFADYQRDEAKGDEYLVLLDGQRLESNEEGFRLTSFAKHGLRLPERAIDTAAVDAAALPTADLRASDDPVLRAELHWRYAMPLAVLALTVLAVALSYSAPRKGRFGNVLYGLLAYIAYANAMVVMRRQVAVEKLPEVPLLWWAHAALIVLALGLFMWRRQLVIASPKKVVRA
ncbi:MAG: LPS export ABC transporter permease LptF [Granulosicoccaceae bacterium]